MNNYRVAIPSLNRVKELGEKTLKTLDKHGISKDIIDIFVANEEQEVMYKEAYPEYNIIRAIIGKRAVSNFIFQEYYDEGQYVLYMDDDIEKIRMKNPRGWERSSFCDDELDLKKELDLAFSECLKSKRNMWGVYPVENHYFMKNQISYDYKFCVGWMWGCINQRSSNLCLIGDGCIEDYERCIRHYLADGGLVRLNHLSCTTKYGNPVGGIGLKPEDREREQSLSELQEHFPGLFRLKMKNGGMNPVLKDSRCKIE
tara:strand:+ start:2584 stop:3354 length:771 start_codon:yes stop_codon:yes gene_type:complete